MTMKFPHRKNTLSGRAINLDTPVCFTGILALCLCVTNKIAAASLEDGTIWETIISDTEKHLRYLDIFPLTSSNFSRCVLQSVEPWVVLLHKGTLNSNWKRTAAELRGVVWFGMIDMEQESTLVESLKFEEPASEGADQIGLARVYPFGRSNVKEKKYHDVVTPHAALSLAVQSLPTDAMTSLKDSEEVSSFLIECMMTSPSRFPVVLVVDYNDPFPPAFISLSIRLKRYFSFGRLDYSATTLLEELDLVKLQLQPPTLVVMASYVSEGKLVQQAIPYKTEQTGSCYKDEEDDDKCMLSYPKLLQFLYNVNRQYRQDLPGNNLADDEEAMMMEDVIDNEKRRFKVNRGSNARSPTLPKVGRRKGITIDMQHGGTIEL